MKIRIIAIAFIFALTNLTSGCGGEVNQAEHPNSSNGAPPDSMAASSEVNPILVEFEEEEYTVPAGYSRDLSITAIYDDDSHKQLSGSDLTWSSSNPAVASVTADGIFVALIPGETVITATSASGESYSVEIHVTHAILLDIQVTPVNATLFPGMTRQYTATGIYSDNTHQDITQMVKWHSSNINVATVTKYGYYYDDYDDHEYESGCIEHNNEINAGFVPGNGGLVTVVGEGVTTITAYIGDFDDFMEDEHHDSYLDDDPEYIAGTTNLTVQNFVLQSLTISPANPSIAAGLSRQLSVTGNYSNGTTQDLTTQVTWSSSDIAIAPVSNVAPNQGLVFGAAPGTVTITATEPVSGMTGTIAFAVSPAGLVSMSVAPAAGSIAKGLTRQFTATGTFTDNSTQDITQRVTWSSSNAVAVTISNNPTQSGLATAKDLGSATILATDPSTGLTATASLSVTQALLVSLRVEPATADITMGYSLNAIATGVYTDLSTVDLTSSVTWTSTDPAIVQVSNAPGSVGLVTSVSQGQTTVSAVDPVSGLSAFSLITVSKPVLVSLTITPASGDIQLGDTLQFSASGLMSDATAATATDLASLVWNSSSSVTLPIDANGLATGASPGIANITATVGAITSNASSVSVKQALYSVGGTVSGLVAGDTLQITNNQTEFLDLTADGTFTFATQHLNGTVYRVSVTSQPAGKTCNVSNGTGTINNASVTDILIICTLVPLDTWTLTGSMNYTRMYHSATLLADGRVLVAGGQGTTGYVYIAEIYDPATETWSTTGSMNFKHKEHAAALLPDGRVLVAGGQGEVFYNRCEIYDPVTNTWTASAQMNHMRMRHTATALPDGRILVTGGYGNSGVTGPLYSAEIYDSATGLWSLTANMSVSRYYQTATLLADGTVFVAGGYGSNGASSGIRNEGEIFNPATGQWSSTANMSFTRYLHASALLSDGRVLVAGGSGTGPNRAEVYDPITNVWSTTQNLTYPRNDFTLSLLPSGKVIAAGGWNYLKPSEVYDPLTNAWAAGGALNHGRKGHKSVTLPDGQVLVVGGYGIAATAGFLSSAELYR